MKNILTSLARKLGALSPSCKEASRLQSEALDHRLTAFDRFGLRCHLVLCKWCRLYGGQIKFLRPTAHQHAAEERHLPEQGLSPAARERIKKRLRSEME